MEACGELVRVETDRLLVGYNADLRENTLVPQYVANPSAGLEHRFRGISHCWDERPRGNNESCALTSYDQSQPHRFQITVRLMQLRLEQLPNTEAPDKVGLTVLRAIESDDFPFEQLSRIAERESWRKEIYRPIYHIHKWWAQRLGSVFRGILLGALAPQGADVLDLFYSPTRFPETVVFDPFMGSGTTLGETLKLGGRAIGRDINPVSYLPGSHGSYLERLVRP